MAVGEDGDVLYSPTILDGLSPAFEAAAAALSPTSHSSSPSSGSSEHAKILSTGLCSVLGLLKCQTS